MLHFFSSLPPKVQIWFIGPNDLSAFATKNSVAFLFFYFFSFWLTKNAKFWSLDTHSQMTFWGIWVKKCLLQIFAELGIFYHKNMQILVIGVPQIMFWGIWGKMAVFCSHTVKYKQSLKKKRKKEKKETSWILMCCKCAKGLQHNHCNTAIYLCYFILFFYNKIP